MNEKIPTTRYESKVESEINFENVDVVYSSDAEIESFFNARIQALEDPLDFIEANMWQFENFKRNRINDGHSDEKMIELFTLRERKMSEEAKVKAVSAKAVIVEKQEEIFEQVRLRLAVHLPNWKPQAVKIVFTVMENSDYMHPQRGEIKADLWRLSFRRDPVEDVIGGISHELFHEWMSEGGHDFSLNSDEFTSPEEAKRAARFRIIDEGMAVHSGGQSLSEHYENQGKNYDTSVHESFAFYKKYFATEDIEDLKKGYRASLQNMGPFYVVGYEIVRKVRDRVGVQKFRELTAQLRDNTDILYEQYKTICLEDDTLPKIE